MNEDMAKRICERLEQGEPVVLATIVSHHGSTPRTAGTRMLITKEGGLFGTVGGGLLEARVIEKASDVLKSGRPAVLEFDLSKEDVSSMDMICGGQLEVLLDCLTPTESRLNVFESWRKRKANKEPGTLITVIRHSGGRIEGSEHCLVTASGEVVGNFPLDNEQLNRLVEKGRSVKKMHVETTDGCSFLVEPLKSPDTVYFLGAGHVSRPTVRLASTVGFRTVVSDDREAFANRDRFPEANDIRVLKDFQDAFKDVDTDTESYIVILTRGHLYDKAVLTQALKTKARYIGMIGSRRKRDAIFEALLGEGYTDDDLKRVHAPIGIDIGAETPEEIAVSIVGELIRVRSGKIV